MSAELPLEPVTVLGHTVGLDLAFNLPHKVHAYNLIIWFTMVIQAIKHSWKRYPGPTLNQLAPKLPQKGL